MVFIRTKFGFDFKFIRVVDVNDTREYFANVFTAFGVVHDGRETFTITDNLGCPIEAEVFGDIIDQFKGSGSFYIVIENKDTRSNNVVTSLEFKNFLLQNNGSDIIEEDTKLNDLREPTLKRLTDKMLAFMIKKFSIDASISEIEQLCLAVINLFPCLKTPNSRIGGIDRIYNHGGKVGKFYNKVHNERNKLKKRKGHSSASPTLEPEEEELIEYFKHCVVRTERDELIAKLRDTVDLRKRLLRDNATNFHESFSFYFADSNLILKDFEFHFPTHDAMALLNKWNEIADVPYKQFDIRLDQFHKFPEESAANMAMYIKLVGSKRTKFLDALGALLVYSDVANEEPMKLINFQNDSPYIIAIFSAYENKVKYYIDLEKHLICVPEGFTFIEAFDMLTKIHKVFNLEYNTKIKAVMHFFDHYLYNFQEGKILTAQMIKVGRALELP